MSTSRRRQIRNVIALLAILIAPAIGLSGSSRSNHRARLSIDLLRHEARQTTRSERLILRGAQDEIGDIARRHHLQVVRWLADGAVLSANSAQVTELAADAGVDALSGDPVVSVGMSVSNLAMGTDQTQAGTSGLLGLGAIPGVTGKGIGVAVIDSGIALHTAVAKKIVANVSFVTGDPGVTDTFGHGTHVAGIIAGSATGVTGLYRGGVAPGVQLVNVRVLGSNGAGYTSDVIAGIDWSINNRARYNIRIINLSLGHAVTESAFTDPLCQAVARANAAGIVVVAAAGNEGRNQNDVRVLGAISSPGNSPFAITVGAVNTFGTASRADDQLADYSSRGPTEYDFIVKPDIAAPGSRIISIEAAGSFIPGRYPYLHAAGTGSNAYMQLSGTSMATPMVSGAVALLLEGAPSLTPAQVKLALQSGATYLPDAGLNGAGAGSMNIWASRKIVANGLSSLLTSTTSLIGGVLSPATGASFWDDGTLASNLYRGSGLRLLSVLNLSRIWSNPGLLRMGELNLVGLTNPLQLNSPNGIMYGGLVRGMADDGDEITWGATIRESNGQNVVWGSADDGDEITWGASDVMTAPSPK